MVNDTTTLNYNVIVGYYQWRHSFPETEIFNLLFTGITCREHFNRNLEIAPHPVFFFSTKTVSTSVHPGSQSEFEPAKVRGIHDKVIIKNELCWYHFIGIVQ